MKSCPSCEKPIVVRVSGRYTCACGETIHLSGEEPRPSPEPEGKRPIGEWVTDFNFNMLSAYLILFVVSCVAWEFDLPDLLGSYSGAGWLAVTCIIAIFHALLLVFFSVAFLKCLFRGKLDALNMIKGAALLIFLLLITFDAINETELVHIRPSFKYLLRLLF